MNCVDLAFRGMKAPGGTLGSGRFGGEAEFGLKISIPEIDDRLEADRVKLKVAPFLLTHNNRPTDEVFVYDVVGGLADPGNDPTNPKPVMPKAEATTPGLPPEVGHHWLGRSWYSVAFTPNAVNLQWVDRRAVLPPPFGP